MFKKEISKKKIQNCYYLHTLLRGRAEMKKFRSPKIDLRVGFNTNTWMVNSHLLLLKATGEPEKKERSPRLDLNQ